MEGRPSAPKIEKTPEISKTYALESGVTVEIKSREFKPGKESPETAPEKATVFLPGWSMGAADKNIDKLCQTFADESKQQTFAISSRSAERGNTTVAQDTDFLYEEARGITAFIKERGIKEITLTGNSQGGDRAIDVAALLSNDPDIKVNGLILMSAVGLYEQGSGELAGKFIQDSMVNTPITMATNPDIIKPGLQVANTIVTNLLKEAFRSKGGSLARFQNEVGEMAKINPHMAEINVPIVLMTGADDMVSDAERIMPSAEEARVRTEMTPAELPEEGSAPDKTFAAREKILQESVFPNSPHIRMLVPEKQGHHGLVFFRPESVARTSLYLLRRHEREKGADQ